MADGFQRLEGPGSARRLRRTRAGFKRASRKRREERNRLAFWFALICVSLCLFTGTLFALTR